MNPEDQTSENAPGLAPNEGPVNDPLTSELGIEIPPATPARAVQNEERPALDWEVPTSPEDTLDEEPIPLDELDELVLEEPEAEPEPEVVQEPELSDEEYRKQVLDRLDLHRDRLMTELKKVIIGQEKVIEELMMVLFAGGHCLLSGAPGLAKTLLIRTLAQIVNLDFKRVQFTPDLMPSDLTGTEIIDEDRTTGRRELRFIKGPIFTNVLLADEINRTPPKTQAALLESMEEKQVSVAGVTHILTRPFYVFATQNPIELEGTYPLPEAQMDRFMFKLQVNYLSEDEELEVINRTTSRQKIEVEPIFNARDMIALSQIVRDVPVADPIARYAVRLAQMSRPSNPNAPDFVKKWVNWGAGTRASQYLILGAKARALLQGRLHVSFEDVRAVALPALRHRILPNFQADADHVDVEEIIERLLSFVEEPKSGL